MKTTKIDFKPIPVYSTKQLANIETAKNCEYLINGLLCKLQRVIELESQAQNEEHNGYIENLLACDCVSYLCEQGTLRTVFSCFLRYAQETGDCDYVGYCEPYEYENALVACTLINIANYLATDTENGFSVFTQFLTSFHAFLHDELNGYPLLAELELI